MAEVAIGAVVDEPMVLMEEDHGPEEVAQRPHGPEAEGHAAPHEEQSSKQHRPSTARDLRRWDGPREEEGAEDATPQGDANQGAAALIGWDMDINAAITMDNAEPERYPHTKGEPEQDC
jgi:hypothetical protein